MDVYTILVVQVCIHMSEFIEFVHFKHVQFLYVSYNSMNLLKVFQGSSLTKNHPS